MNCRNSAAGRFHSNRQQGSTGLPVGECVPERSEGLPAKPVKRSLHSVKVPRACPWVSTEVIGIDNVSFMVNSASSAPQYVSAKAGDGQAAVTFTASASRRMQCYSELYGKVDTSRLSGSECQNNRAEPYHNWALKRFSLYFYRNSYQTAEVGAVWQQSNSVTSTAIPVPTVSEWGMMLFTLLQGLCVFIISGNSSRRNLIKLLCREHINCPYL